MITQSINHASLVSLSDGALVYIWNRHICDTRVLSDTSVFADYVARVKGLYNEIRKKENTKTNLELK